MRFSIKTVNLAIDPSESLGRKIYEPNDPHRNVFERDRDRIIHSSAFRRLAHKTQVFVYHEGDHFRSRLTHTLEVAQIARSMARRLRLNEAITEAIALAHDFGHSPFGHTGEDALDDVMKSYGGFDHNAQSFAHVAYLENGYAGFEGLNLSYETLDGILKHNGAMQTPDKISHLGQVLARSEVTGLVGNNAVFKQPFLEAQLAAISDDIAYTAHDLDDGLRADLFSIDDLVQLPLIGDIVTKIRFEYKDIQNQKIIFELKRRLITCFIEDIIKNIEIKIDCEKFENWRDICAYSDMIAQFSSDIKDAQSKIFGFLMKHMYRHPNVVEIRQQMDQVTRELTLQLMSNPELLPEKWTQVQYDASEMGKARMVCDFVAGMTDRYALEMHSRIFD